MNLLNSFRFYKEIHGNKFDDNLSDLKSKLLIGLCYFSYFSGLSAITNSIVTKILSKKRIKDKEIAFILSKNQMIIYEELEKLNILLPSYNLTLESIESNEHMVNISRVLLFFSTLSNSKKFIETYKASKEDKFYKKNRFKLFKLVGCELAFTILIENANVIVKFNDHGILQTLLYDISTSKGLKTIYIQHAPVSYRFPPLYHDLNILFSKDSIEKYSVEDASNRVFEFLDIRMLKGENYKPANKNVIENKLLIAFNKLDKLDQVHELIKVLSIDFKIILRAHPADKRNLEKLKAVKHVEISKHKNIWEDMGECEAVLSNESAIPLEALFFKKRFYKIAMISEPIDNYSFIKKGLITKQFFDITNLKESIINKEICYDISKLNYFIGDIENKKKLSKQLKNEIFSLRS